MQALWWIGASIGGALLKTAAGAAGLYTLLPVIGMILLAIGGYAVVLASKLFDMLVYTTVINLGGALASLGILGSDGKYGGLDVVWMAFRDLANILIIGIFVFIAISIILGLEQFGQKKLIARVLIIAILINFSLLFSKIIVDVSNLVAFQFYKGMVGVDQNGNIPQTSFSPTATQVGIAGAFMGKLGIQTALDGGKIFEFKDTAGNTQSAQNLVTGAGGLTDPKGRILAFIYSIVVTGFLLFLSYILAKASYLLASRAILLILLMMTSSLAFASYLIPQFSEHKFGWSGWWNSLLRSAFFGPLLVMFLWASLTVLKGVKAGSIGSAVIQPTNPESLATFFKIILTTGLLYASIRVANSFSDDVPGFAGALQGYGGKALKGYRYGLENPIKYFASKKAYYAKKQYESESSTLVQAELAKKRANPNYMPSAEIQSKFASLQSKIGSASKVAGGNFGTSLNDKFSKLLKEKTSVFTEGAGKGGYEKKVETKEKEKKAHDSKDLEQAMKSADPTKEEAKIAYGNAEAEVARQNKELENRKAQEDERHRAMQAELDDIRSRKDSMSTTERDAANRRENQLSKAMSESKDKIGRVVTQLNKSEQRIEKIARENLEVAKDSKREVVMALQGKTGTEARMTLSGLRAAAKDKKSMSSVLRDALKESGGDKGGSKESH